MVRSFLDPQAATAHVDVEPVVQGHATCPLCHTTDVFMSDYALAAGGGWRCTRCGQQWDARRLATVAAYAAWTLERGTATGRA
jgi:transposase-like protein